MSKQKIGIFSGTFDPIHDGHVQFALDAISQEKLDKVYFMVERNPRRKQGVRAFEHRQNMVQLAIAKHSELGSIITDQDRFSAHETLPILKGRFGGHAKLALMAGDDMLAHMKDWPHIDELLKEVSFIFGVRGQKQLALKRIKAIEGLRGISFDVSILKSTHDNVSSSRIRNQIKNHETPSYINSKVANYIKEEGLYSSADSAKN